MSFSSTDAPTTTMPLPASRRKRWLLIAFLLVALLAGGLGWAWPWYEIPALPDFAFEAADPAVMEAVEAARQAVRNEPRSAAAWGRLGMVLRAHDEREHSQACFAQAECLDPHDPRWPYLQGLRLLLGEPEAALPYLRRAADLASGKGEQESAARLRLAEALLENGRLNEATNQLRRVLEVDPANPRVRFDFGLLAQARGETRTAKTHFLAVIRTPFARQKAAIQLATACKRLGEEAEAATFALQAAQPPPDVPWPDPFIAEYMQFEVGRQHRLKHVEALEGQGRLAEAAQELRELVRRYPDAHTYLNLGIVLAKMNARQEAEAVLRRVIRLAPDKVQAPYFLAVILYQEAEEEVQQPEHRAAAPEKYRQAARWAYRATQLQADHAFAHLYLGLARWRLGQRDEALKALRAAVRCRPDFVEIHLYLAEVLAEVGQLGEARACLENALRLAPNDPRPRAALARLEQASP